MADGVVAIRREIEAAASTGELMALDTRDSTGKLHTGKEKALDTLECLDYVQHSRAGSSAKVCAARVRSLAHVLSELHACSSPHCMHAAHHPSACMQLINPPLPLVSVLRNSPTFPTLGTATRTDFAPTAARHRGMG
jgi:hypothetical protein